MTCAAVGHAVVQRTGAQTQSTMWQQYGRRRSGGWGTLTCIALARVLGGTTADYGSVLAAEAEHLPSAMTSAQHLGGRRLRRRTGNLAILSVYSALSSLCPWRQLAVVSHHSLRCSARLRSPNRLALCRQLIGVHEPAVSTSDQQAGTDHDAAAQWLRRNSAEASLSPTSWPK